MGEQSEGSDDDHRPPPSPARNALTASSSSASESSTETPRSLSQLPPNTPREEHPGTGHPHGQTPGMARSDPQARDRGASASDMSPPAEFPSSRSLQQPPIRRQLTHKETPMAESTKDGRFKAPSAAGVLALLRCPVCERTLESPTTLRCGHTVCSVHVQLNPVEEGAAAESAPLSRSTTGSSERTASGSSSSAGPASQPDPLANLPSCPISSCVAPSSRHRAPIHATAPSTSRVAYYPPPSSITGSPAPSASTLSTETRSPATARPRKVASPRLDITISKVLQITLGAVHEGQQPGHAKASATAADRQCSSDDDDGDTEEELPSRRSSRLYATPPPGRSASLLKTPPGVASRDASSHRPTSTIPSSRGSSTRECSHSGSDSDMPRVKRRKTAPPSPPLGSDNPEVVAKFLKSLQAEVQCEICFSLLYKPVTTPCQHTFCSKCLSRTLDHSILCPLCRQDLPGFAYFYEHAVNKVVESLIVYAFPNMLTDRKAAIEEEERNARLDTPVFVCQLSFPGLPTILHIFEPRYRLMLRRCLQTSDPAFGMLLPPRTNALPGAEEYGTMLEIKSVQMLPDGRSMVETKGTYRFRIAEKGTLDGYMVARTVRIDDLPDDADDLLERTLTVPQQGLAPEPTVEQLMETCREFYDQLKDGTAPWVVQQLNSTYGPMPEDPSTFGFWMAVLLPIDDHQKASLLAMRSPRLRLRLVAHWIENLNNSWWFGQGCVIS